MEIQSQIKEFCPIFNKKSFRDGGFEVGNWNHTTFFPLALDHKQTSWKMVYWRFVNIYKFLAMMNPLWTNTFKVIQNKKSPCQLIHFKSL